MVAGADAVRGLLAEAEIRLADGSEHHLFADVFGRRLFDFAEGDGDRCEEIEGEAEAIEAGAEVGAGCAGTRTVTAVACIGLENPKAG